MNIEILIQNLNMNEKHYKLYRLGTILMEKQVWPEFPSPAKLRWVLRRMKGAIAGDRIYEKIEG